MSKFVIKISFLFFILLTVLLVVGCGSDDLPEGHNDIEDGVAHKAGKEDPLKNCTSCHGSDLEGGSGDSCYDCHDTSDHTLLIEKIRHRPSNTNCSNCHGLDNSGGLGRACSDCH